MFWNWIRTRARDAVLAGLNDAVEVLDQAEDDTASEAASRPRLRLGYRADAVTPTLPGAGGVDANTETVAAGVPARRAKK